MTKREQRRIINELCRTHKAYMLDRLQHVPERWDGIELRTWYAIVSWHYRYKMNGARARAFNHDMLTLNL
jgi:hypothetical protein